MKLIENWQAVLAKAWSVKFSALAAILGGIEVAIALIQPAGVPNGVFAAFAGAVSTAAFVARLIAQKELSDGTKG